MLDQRLLVDVGTLGEHHVRLDRLAVCGWGTPITATSATAGCSASTSSTSAGYTLKPDDDDEVLGPVDEVQVAVVVGRRRCRRCAASRRR